LTNSIRAIFVCDLRFLDHRHGCALVPALTRPRPYAWPTSRVDTPAHSPYPVSK